MQADRKSSMLIVGHPGHEIRCHGWLSRHRPTVVVMTSGGGASKPGRIASTLRGIERAGAVASPLFGNFSDHEVYGFMLRQEVGELSAWTKELSDLIRQERPALILTDMVEGYNSSHDLVAYLTSTAVERAATLGWDVPQVLCQPLTGPPDMAWGGKIAPTTTLELTEEEFGQKLSAARDYPELADEVETALKENSALSFKKECLYTPAKGMAILTSLPDAKPYYETFGEIQVSRGKFRDVIRHAQHLVPLVKSIRAALGLSVA